MLVVLLLLFCLQEVCHTTVVFFVVVVSVSSLRVGASTVVGILHIKRDRPYCICALADFDGCWVCPLCSQIR